MAAALAQDGLDAAAEFLELLIRHEGLNGACKTAAVHAACAVAAQQMLGQRQRERDLLDGPCGPRGSAFCGYVHDESPDSLTYSRKAGEIVVFECTQLQTQTRLLPSWTWIARSTARSPAACRTSPRRA